MSRLQEYQRVDVVSLAGISDGVAEREQLRPELLLLAVTITPASPV